MVVFTWEELKKIVLSMEYDDRLILTRKNDHVTCQVETKNTRKINTKIERTNARRNNND